ncbi:MAG TPA: phosphatase PAP2/dual specificity phosphatase family protein, partial [Rhodocyclaceae bacterium]|nr:phosphatase PAP2/dual specificity phosphatase family protein [Rhodocyclaceae bacterium]
MNQAALSLPVEPPILWGRSIAWLLLLGPFFFLSYGYANGLAASLGVERSLYFAWERGIPFWPWTILPYWSIDLLYGFSFLCCRGRGAVDRHALRLLSVQLLSVACFILFPLRFAFARPESDGLFGALFDALTSFDQPYNQAPSLHIGLLVLIWAQFARLATTPLRQALIHGWALLIGLSVLTTWQHHFIDVPTGAVVGLLCLWLWPDAERAPLPWRQGLSSSRRRWQLATRYLLGAACLLLPAVLWQGLWLWCAWPALSLLMVALCYGWLDGAGFQKREGEQSLAVAVLMWPYRIGARISALYWRWVAAEADAIADGLWLGRLPSRRRLERDGFAAVVDVAPEFPCPQGRWHIVSLPWLDLVPPTPAELDQAVHAIEAARQHGKTLVACALGYSRSAAAVAAWLYWSGRFPSIDEAIAEVQARRPQVRIKEALR